ncbi:MAG: ABC transporter permease [SAR202 cluster bacterium]|nr:ABC transporter permease [SAR202 cluster bacterium]
MVRFIGRRVIYSLVVLLTTSFIVFGLSRAAGDPRNLFLTEYTTKETWDAWGREYNLDKPLVIQYVVWLGKALRGDFGHSLRDHINALDVIMQRVPATLQLAGASFIAAIFIGVPLGVMSAVKRGTFWDYVGRTLALFGQALPPYWLGVMLILLFAVSLDVLPSGRKGGIDHYILPALTLGWGAASGLLRLTRSAMLEVLDSEYIKFARSKGVTASLVVWKHAFRNALIAPLTYSTLLLAGYLTGTVVTETVFSWPGVGRLAVTAVFNNDFPVLTGVVLIGTAVYLAVNLLTDVIYALMDPRIRFG